MSLSDFSELRAAVVALACEDYLNLLSGFQLTAYSKDDPYPRVDISELERFFTGDDFQIYSDLDGKDLMKKVRQFAKKMVVKFNVKKIARHRYGCYRVDDESQEIIPGSVFHRIHDAVEFAADLNGLSVIHYQKCRHRDGLI